MLRLSRLSWFAWTTLAFNVAVILWGAYVRATGSGAGCGEHWPTCNGQVIPTDPSVKTLIEFTHRATSGVALLLVLALLGWVRKSPDVPGHARTAAWGTLGFMLSEAAVGAGLVLFRLVADNESMARAMFMSVHLCNTFVLLAFMVATAWFLSGGPAMTWRHPDRRVAAWLGTSLWLMLLGVSGAVAALGDTLHPAASLADALHQDLSPTASLLVRLRVLHPVLALVAALLVTVWTALTPGLESRAGRLLRRALLTLVGTQLVAGLVNVVLLAPVWMQLVHLLLADAVWLTWILAGLVALAPSQPPARASAHL
jgi:cytochrome c oxidase assembly protein subunit 15